MYSWDSVARRFRDEAGKFVSRRAMDRFRNELLDQAVARIDQLTSEMLEGRLTRLDWRQAMRAEIKRVRIQEYMLGRGGRNMMTQADWGRLGADIRRQYAYLDRLWAEVSNGTISEAQLQARARLYVAGANVSYAQGQAAAWNNLQLPAHPGDGSTSCRQYCRCSWSITETKDAIVATWKLGGSRETCSDCSGRASSWVGLRFDAAIGVLIEEEEAA